MRIEYGKVIRAFSSDEKGGQLFDIECSVANKTYRDCELLSFRGVTAIPKEGDTVVMLNLKNQENVVLGVIEQIDLKLKPGEVMIHAGELKETNEGVPDYNLTTKMFVNEDHELEISRGETDGDDYNERAKILIDKDNDMCFWLKDDSGTELSKFCMKQDGSVKLETDEGTYVEILPSGQVNINTPVKMEITAPRVDII